MRLHDHIRCNSKLASPPVSSPHVWRVRAATGRGVYVGDRAGRDTRGQGVVSEGGARGTRRVAGRRAKGGVMDEHEQRMQLIHAREAAYRQMGLGNLDEAHDAIDYLFTRVNLLTKLVEKWQDLGESGMGMLCNSQPDSSLDDEHRKAWFKRFAEYLDTYYGIEKIGKPADSEAQP